MLDISACARAVKRDYVRNDIYSRKYLVQYTLKDIAFIVFLR